MKPSIGRIVHYWSHGSADGTYKPECRAAVVTAVKGGWNDPQGVRQWVVDLTVFNPEGLFIKQDCRQDEGAETPGSPDCENAGKHADGPFRYCACGWMEATRKGGTWHWPEREAE